MVFIGRTKNKILSALPAEEFVALVRRLVTRDLPVRNFLVFMDQPIDGLYFVETGTVSMISTLSDGAQIEVGLIGSEGVVGLPAFLGAPTSPLDGMVQVSGSALQLKIGDLKSALELAPSLRGLLMRYTDSFHSQVTQTAVCNNRHSIEQRLSRWILMTHDRAGRDRFLMTHEFMSKMLGVQRPGVTLAIGALRRAGLISHEKGVVRVLDRDGLEDAACECYAVVQSRFDWQSHIV